MYPNGRTGGPGSLSLWGSRFHALRWGGNPVVQEEVCCVSWYLWSEMAVLPREQEVERAMDWMLVPHPHQSICRNPNPQCDGIKRGLGRYLGHECGAHMNGISPLIKGTPHPKSSLALFSAFEDKIRSWQSATQKQLSPKPYQAGTLIWTSNFWNCEK